MCPGKFRVIKLKLQLKLKLKFNEEYGATVGFFPVDMKTIAYLRQTSTD